MTSTDFRKALFALASAPVVAGLLLVTPYPAMAADTDKADRLDRKVRVMERVLDEVLVQSPNVFVSPGGTVRGLVLEDYGVLFTIDAGLGLGLHGIQVEMLEDLYQDAVKAGEREPAEGYVLRQPLMEIREVGKKSQEEKLAGLRTELTEALIDYGATLGELGDDQWVTVAVFLGGRNLFMSSSSGKRLILKVKMSDLRKHNAGQLSRDAIVAKVKIEER